MEKIIILLLACALILTLMVNLIDQLPPDVIVELLRSLIKGLQ